MTKVKFYSLLREKLGRDTVEVKGNRKLIDVVEDVVTKTGAHRSLFFEGKRIKEEYAVLLNGKSITFEKGVIVKDKDEVSIVPLVAGG